MCNGQPQIEVTLYEYFCVHVCALVGNISAEHFHILVCYAENILCITINRYILYYIFIIRRMCYYNICAVMIFTVLC